MLETKYKYTVLGTYFMGAGSDSSIVAEFDTFEEMYDYVISNNPQDVIGSDWDKEWTVTHHLNYVIIKGKIQPKYKKMLKYRSIDA